MKYIDIHGHVQFPEYDADRESVFKNAVDNEVGMIIVGTDLESSKKAVELAQNHKDVWATVGIHPVELSRPNLGDLASDPKVVAIGECGLDYFHGSAEKRSEQIKIFEEHIDLANSVNKSLMLHIRNEKGGSSAYREALDILDRKAKVRANFHFFAGSIKDAKDIVERNHTISFTGVITFTHDYDEVVRSVPLTHIMSETDCPFVTPVPYRGKRNEPVYVTEVVKAIARIRGEDEVLVRDQLVSNAKEFFSIF